MLVPDDEIETLEAPLKSILTHIYNDLSRLCRTERLTHERLSKIEDRLTLVEKNWE